LKGLDIPLLFLFPCDHQVCLSSTRRRDFTHLLLNDRQENGDMRALISPHAQSLVNWFCHVIGRQLLLVLWFVCVSLRD
jgi:hypothetical protein